MQKKLTKNIKFLNLIQKSLLEKNLLKPNQKILLSISGGQDSVSLFFIIIFFQNQWNWKIKIIWCNHLWQKDSFYLFIELSKLIYNFQLCFICSIGINKLLTEKSSRNWRYSNFCRLSYYYTHQIIVLGHTSSDRIETILFNLFRGSGINSFYFLSWYREFFLKKIHLFPDKNFLINIKTKSQQKSFVEIKDKKINKKKSDLIFFIKKEKQPNDIRNKIKITRLRPTSKKYRFKKNQNISYITKGKKYFYIDKIEKKKTELVRPLLILNRSNTKNFIDILNLPVFPDKTNQYKKHLRNKIRKQLLPVLRLFFNPQIDNTIFQYSEIGIDEEKYLQYFLNKLYFQIEYQNNCINSLDISLIKKFPYSIKRRILRKYLEKVLKKMITFSQLEKLLNFLSRVQKNINFQENIKFIFFPKIGLLIIYNNQLIILSSQISK